MTESHNFFRWHGKLKFKFLKRKILKGENLLASVCMSDSDTIPSRVWDVHILIPQTTGFVNEVLDKANEYGKEEQKLELLDTLRNLNCSNIIFHDVTLQNYDNLFCDIVSIRDIVVLNLCDGAESDGYPGISVCKKLSSLGVAYTGSNSSFFETTTSKIIMKHLFESFHVPTPKWIDLTTFTLESFNDFHYPIVIKPAVAYASCGITRRSVVWSPREAYDRTVELHNEFGSEILAEEFVNGPEFTAFVVGDYDATNDVNIVTVYPVVERAFRRGLQWHERLLTFDEYWREDQDPFYYYRKAPDCLQTSLQDISRSAYQAVLGTGYGRVDLRMDSETGEIMVLEVNSNCGLSGKPDSSVGNICSLSNKPFYKVVEQLFINAFAKRDSKEVLLSGGSTL